MQDSPLTPHIVERLPSLPSCTTGKRDICSRFLWALLVLLFVFSTSLVGCGGGGGGGSTGGGQGVGLSGSDTSPQPTPSGPPVPGQTSGQVVVKLTLAANASVPVSVTTLRFTAYSAAGRILYGPRTYPKANVVVLDGVPTNATLLQIDFLTGGTVTQTGGAPLSLTPGGSQVINDPATAEPGATLRAITLTPPSAVMAVGTSVQFVATGLFTDNTTRDLTPLAAWDTTAPQVVTVSGFGLSTAQQSGTAAITARFGSVTASAGISVSGATLSTIQVTPGSVSLPSGTTRQFQAVGTFSDRTTQDLTSQVTWSTAPSGVLSVSASGLATGLASGTTTVRATFSGVSGTAIAVVTSATLTSIQVTPGSAFVPKGFTQQLTATGIYSDSTTSDLSSQVTWTTSPGGIATISTAGLATGVGVGTTTVTAAFGGRSGSATLRVSAAAPTALQVTPSTLSLPKGVTQQLTATASFSDSSTLDVTSQVAWSSASAAATVSPTGLVTAVSQGASTVTATLGAVNGHCALTVTAAKLMTLQLTPAVSLIPAGTTQQLTAIGVYSDSSTQDLSTQVSWISSSPSVAAVSASGVAQGLSQGRTFISASAPGVPTAFVDLSVSPVVLTSIQVTAPNANLPRNASEQLTAIGTYSDSSTRDITGQVAWTSAPTGLVTVNASGLATGVTAGSATVSATMSGVSGSTGVTVVNVTLQSIQVTAGNSSLPRGAGTQLTAIGTYSDASTLDLTAQVGWSTSPTGIATVTSSGRATGVGLGSTTVTASLGAVNGSTGLTVTAATLQSIQVTPAAPAIAVGTTQQLTATGVYTDSSTVDLTSQVGWISSGSGVASVTAGGLVAGVSVGSVTVTASFGGKSGTADVNVQSSVLRSIQITPSSPSVPLGTTQQLTATGVFSDSSTQNLTSQVSWSSAPGGFVAVSTSGLVRTLAAGSPTVTATFGGLTASVTVTVTNASLQSIQVTPSNPSVPIGTSRQLTATGSYSDGKTRDITSQVSWTTVPTGIFTVTTNGLATAQSAGSTTVSATLGAVVGSTTLTVSAASLQSIQVTPATPSIAKGLTQQFTAIGTYSDSSTQDITTQVSWSPSDTTYATITSGGLATARKPGIVTITATSGSVSGTARLAITSATVSSIAITPAIPTVALGATQPLVATATLSDGSTQNVSSAVGWTSSNTGVATITAAGGATGVSLGTTSVTATYLTITSPAVTLTVTPTSLVSLSISSASANVANGTGTQLTALGTWSDGSVSDLTAQVSWTTSPTGFATVTSSGLASGVAPGSTTVIATSGVVSASTRLTVTSATLTQIDVTPATATLGNGAGTQFKAIGTFSDSSTQDLTSQVSWTSSQTSAATIDLTGLATRVSDGSSQITATLGAVSGSASLAVSSATLQSIAVTPTLPSVVSGATQQMTAIATFSDSSTQDVTRQVTWSSSDVTSAVVTSTGLVSTLGAGTSQITATLGAVNGSTSFTVSAAAASSWTRRTSGTSQALYRVAYGGSAYVAVGLPQPSPSPGVPTLLTSSDAASWTPRSAPTTKALLGAAYGASTWVVVGNAGTILTSSDLATWTAQTSGTAQDLSSVTWTGTQFVAVGKAGTVLTSPDGVTWTAQASGVTTRLSDVTYGNSLLVAVGDAGAVLTSSDAVTWTSRTSGVSVDLASATYGNGLYVAVGASGAVITSADATTWTAAVVSSSFHRGVTFGSGTFVVVGANGEIATSPDASSWRLRASNTTNFLLGVTYGGGRFVGVGASGEIVTSP